MKFGKTLAVATAAFLAACGTAKTSQQQQPATEQPAAAPTVQAQSIDAAPTPSVLVAKVPLDAKGAELTDQVETRELASTPADAAAVLATFAQSTPVKVTDELDKTTSSEQWGRSWSWKSNSNYGYGYGGSYNAYSSYGSYSGWGGYGYSNYGYSSSYGYGYGWSRRACYNYGYGYGGYGYGLTSGTPAVVEFAHVDAFTKDGANYYLYTKI